MDITVYLPDDIGGWAKDNGVNLSATLRAALLEERDRRLERSEIAAGGKTYDLRIEGEHGSYTARLHAKELASDGRNQWLYLAADGTVYVYDNDAQRLYDMAEQDLETWAGLTPPEFYAAIANALGNKPPIIDMGRAD